MNESNLELIKMLPLKLVRSLLVSGQILPHNNNTKPKVDQSTTTKRQKTPLLLFTPTKELITDTYRLATIARDMGMDLHPTPSLSHIIFSYPSSSSSSTSSSSSSPSPPLSWSTSSWVLPKDAVLITFPLLTSSSVSHLRSFVSLSKGLFKLVFFTHDDDNDDDHKVVVESSSSSSNWDCCSISLFSRITGDKIKTMEGFCRVLTGAAWTLYKTNDKDSSGSRKCVYLFRKVDRGRVAASRIRELRLPTLDFRNAPLRILQYVVLMTDNVFYLAS